MRTGKGRISPAWRRKLLTLAVASCFAGEAAYANPTGPQVVHGQASIAAKGNVLTVTNTPGTVINWQGFSIASQEITRFLQQSAASAVLNRVVGVNPSTILGQLQSNGRVFLINPNGITIGAGATIDVAGFVASTLNLSDADFLAGRHRFSGAQGAGAVINQGTIKTPAGGMVYLVGQNVENHGVIQSPKGEILLAAGKSIELVDAGTPEIRVQISAPQNEALNLGQLLAAGGRIGMYGGLVRQGGVANANTAVVGENGKIVFKAAQEVRLEAGSTTTASGPTAGSIRIEAESGKATVAGTVEANATAGRGGNIELAGHQGVTVESTGRISANGTEGGTVTLSSGAGAVQIAGQVSANASQGRGGQVTIAAATQATVAPAAKILANGSQAGGAVSVSAAESVNLDAGSVVQASGASGGAVVIEAAQGAVEIAGVIEAIGADGAGGEIRVTALTDVTLNDTGVLATLGSRGGEVRVEARQGTTLAAGAISAYGQDGPGGMVYLLGPRVGLIRNANVNASGRTGGGTVLVGGDFQGKNPEVPNAQRTYVGPDASISADAIEAGDGGKVILWADNDTRSLGAITARGGAQFGDGGFVETSGKRYLEVGIPADASAPKGKAGVWLLDPANVEIVAAGTNTNIDTTTSGGTNTYSPFEATIAANSAKIGNDVINAALDAGTNVVVDTVSAGNTEAGDITVNAAITLSSATPRNVSLSLNADGSILVNSAISATGAGNVLSVNLGKSGVTTGSVAFGGGGSVTTQGGDVSVFAGTTVTLGAIDTGAGALSVTAGGNIDQIGSLIIGGATTLTSNGTAISANLSTGSSNAFNSVSLVAGTGTFGTVSVTDTVDAMSVGGSAGTLTAVAADQLTLTGGSYTTLNATAKASGIDQSGALIVSGTTTLTADTGTGQAFDLSTQNNDFGTVSLATANAGTITTAKVTDTVDAMSVGGSAGTLTAVAAGVLTLAGGSYTTLNATSQTSIGQSGVVSGTTLNAKTLNNTGGAIALNNPANDFATINLQARNAGDTANAAGTISYVDATGFAVAAANTTSTVNLTAGGAITDSNGGASNVTASSLTVSAGTGIDLDTTITTLTLANVTGVGNIDISDTAGGLAVTNATTANGSILLNATGGDLTVGTSVTSGGTSKNVTLSTTTAGDVILTGTTNAGGDQVTVNSAGAINGGETVTAATVDLNAVTGIGNTTALNLAATTITADSTNGNIDVNNALATAVAVSSLTTGTGNIVFDQTGGGAVSYGTAKTVDGTILLTGADGLTVGTKVEAGGTKNVTLTTSGGSVTLTGTTSAAGAQVQVNSAGAIDGGGLVTAKTVDLNAATGIGDTTALNLAATAITADTASGKVDINNTNVAATTVSSLTTGAGPILFDQSGGGDVSFNGAINADGNVVINSTGLVVFTASGDINSGNGSVSLTGSKINTAADVTTSNKDVSFNSPTALTDNILISSGSGKVTFVDTLDGSGGLTVTASGDTTFSKAVGGTTALGNLTLDGGGSTLVNGGNMKTVGDQTYSDGITLGAATTFTATASTSTIAFGSSLTAGANALTISGDEINFGGAVAGTGALALQANTAGAGINVGSAAGATVGVLDLSEADIAALANGFSSITIGAAAGKHAINIGNATFTDPLTIRAPATGGNLTISGALVATDNAPITLATAGTIGGSGTVTGASVTISQASGVGAVGAPLKLNTPLLSAFNSGAGGVFINNAGPVTLFGQFKNDATGGELRLTTTSGSINTDVVPVQSKGGRIALVANDGAGGATGNIVVGAGGINSGNGQIALHAADNITVNGSVNAGTGGLRMIAGTGPGINAAHSTFTGTNPPAATEPALDENGLITLNAPISANTILLVSSTTTTPTIVKTITQSGGGAITSKGSLTAVTLRGGGAPGNGGATVDLNDANPGNNSTGDINLFACSFDGCPAKLPTAPFVNVGAPVPPFSTALFSDGQLFYSDVGGTSVNGIGTAGDFRLFTPGSVTIAGPSLSAQNLFIEAQQDINVNLIAPFTNNDINGGAPGGSLNFIAGGNVNYNSKVAGSTIGSKAVPFNHDLVFTAAGNVTVGNAIYVGNGNFVVQANQPVSINNGTLNIPATGTGSVIMQGNHEVTSKGGITVRGVNFTMQGGDVGSLNQAVTGQKLSAVDPIVFEISGAMRVLGGASSAAADGSATIEGGYVQIGTAASRIASLELKGGTSTVTGTTNRSSDAKIAVTSLDLFVDQDVTLAGGTATITSTAGPVQSSSASALLRANVMKLNVLGNVLLNGGNASAASGGNTATASAIVSSGASFTPVISGDLNVTGGTALAQPVAGKAAKADARAEFGTDGDLILRVTGDVSVQGGAATATTGSGGNAASAISAAVISADGIKDLNIGGHFNVTGGAATSVGGNTTATALAGTDAGMAPSSSVTLTVNTGGNMVLRGGTESGANSLASAAILSAGEIKMFLNGSKGLVLAGGSGSDLFQLVGSTLFSLPGRAYPITIEGVFAPDNGLARGDAFVISGAPPLNLDSLLAAFLRTTDCVTFSGGSCTVPGSSVRTGETSKVQVGGTCK